MAESSDKTEARNAREPARGARQRRAAGLIGRARQGVRKTLGGLAATHATSEVPGAQAGIEPQELARMPSGPERVRVTVTDYSPARVQVQEINDFEDFIIQHRPEWVAVRWINVDGLTNMDIVRGLAEKYDLHPLAIEDVLHVPQRPKCETYPSRGEIHARLFVIARMVQLVDDHPEGEQISFFLGQKTLLTLQERPPPGPEEKRKNDVFDPIRVRLQTAGSRVRLNDASFLLYTLLDAIVDHFFPILEHYSDRLEDLEDEVLMRPSPRTIKQIHQVKRELLLLRRAVWPMREVISVLTREQHECLSETSRTYFRDVYDHAVQIIDMVETYREFASGLTETYMSALSNRMNEIMKVLTIITTIFVPLTFLAGVYGMNFTYLPEKDQWWGYPAFWGVCVSTAVVMMIWFRRKHWI